MSWRLQVMFHRVAAMNVWIKSVVQLGWTKTNWNTKSGAAFSVGIAEKSERRKSLVPARSLPIIFALNFPAL
jgi:hypothetical protein